MLRRNLAVILAATMLLSGCPAGRPQVIDPYAKLRGRKKPYEDLSIALIQSETSKRTMQYFQKEKKWLVWLKEIRWSQDLGELFRLSFGNVVIVDSFQEAREVDADLIGVLDVYAKFKRSSAGGWPCWLLVFMAPLAMACIKVFNHPSANVEMGAIFLTLDQEQIDVVRVIKTERTSGAAGDLTKLIIKVIREGQKEFGKELRSSPKLFEFAKKVRAAKAAAAPVAAAPVEPGVRSDVDHPAYKNKPDLRNFALVIGIEDYSLIPKADFAERDAKAVREHLIALGYPVRNILFLTGNRAGRAGIEKYVESWLPRNVMEDSRVFVYFSGHGAPDTETGQAFLVPWDGDPKFLKDTGYPLKRLYKKLSALKAKEIVVAMDACFSGAGGRSVLAKGTRPLVTKVDTGSAGRLTVLSASAADEITGTVDSQGHGLFTYYFLKGLGGAAAEGGSGKVTAKGLYDYLLPEVQDAARRQNRDQTPALMGAKDLVLRAQ